jgi:glutaconate CoA-transferase subunit B
VTTQEFRSEELLADVIANLIGDVRHVAVGNASPIPATASLLARERGRGRPYVSLLGSPKNTFWTDGARELFDCAGQGRIDVFFLSGGQIDGHGNINLVEIGEHGHPKVRFPGSFGSAYLYYVVPKVILFRTEHSKRTLVPDVDFISAPGSNAPNVFRTGGPIALVTNRCLFSFASGRFTLTSVHPGHTVEEGRTACRSPRRPRRKRWPCCAEPWPSSWPTSIRSSRPRCSGPGKKLSLAEKIAPFRSPRA